MDPNGEIALAIILILLGACVLGWYLKGQIKVFAGRILSSKASTEATASV